MTKARLCKRVARLGGRRRPAHGDDGCPGDRRAGIRGTGARIDGPAGSHPAAFGPLRCPRRVTTPATMRYNPTSNATNPGKTIISKPNKIRSRAAISREIPRRCRKLCSSDGTKPPLTVFASRSGTPARHEVRVHKISETAVTRSMDPTAATREPIQTDRRASTDLGLGLRRCTIPETDCQYRFR